MPTILLYNNSTNGMETYTRGLSQPMPYNAGSLTVSEFRGSSRSNLLWTDRRTMEAWNSFRYIYGSAIYVGYAFKRPWEGGHGTRSQHYAGVSFDAAQNLTATRRNSMRNLAISSGIWNYVEPAYLTPTWVHFDERWVSTAYPVTRSGSRGPYVCIAQDALSTLGYDTGGLDGIFGARSHNAVVAYQTRRGLTADGILGSTSWLSLMNDVVGRGSTGTTISP